VIKELLKGDDDEAPRDDDDGDMDVRKVLVIHMSMSLKVIHKSMSDTQVYEP